MTDGSKWPARRLGMVAEVLRAFAAPTHQTRDRPQAPPPLSDEEAMAQVVNAARQIVEAARLGDVAGAFRFESCNDQGKPPYRGRVDMSFAVPADAEPQAYFRQIADMMAGSGWMAGPPPGKRPFGVVIHTETVMAIFGSACGASTRGTVQVCGECRNMTDHCDDGMTTGADVSARLTGS
jgi:hypothetical protein